MTKILNRIQIGEYNTITTIIKKEESSIEFINILIIVKSNNYKIEDYFQNK